MGYNESERNEKSMISSNVKYLRTKYGMSQEALAEKLEVTRQTVAKWESGVSLPDVRKCADIALLFDVSIDALVTLPLNDQKDAEMSFKEGKYFFGIVKVGERGQVVIPKHARQVYGINPGDRLLALGDQRGMALAKMKVPDGFSFDE